jgi:hypothetical protein
MVSRALAGAANNSNAEVKRRNHMFLSIGCHIRACNLNLT